MSEASWRSTELFLKTCDLIGDDRLGTRRDDGYHRNMRRRFEAMCRDFCSSMREALAKF